MSHLSTICQNCHTLVLSVKHSIHHHNKHTLDGEIEQQFQLLTFIFIQRAAWGWQENDSNGDQSSGDRGAVSMGNCEDGEEY